MLDRARRTTRFGRCEVIHDRRELLVNGLPVPLGSRAFDILELLVEARGMLVTKDEILRKVWAGVVVEENNLQVHMSALRKALGTDRGLIKTVSGRGYRLLISADGGTDSTGHSSATNLPEPASELIGRDQALADVLGLVAAHRIVTLTGLGGIGKTRIAVEAARQLLPRFSDGAWLAELAPLASDDLVLDTVATALGIEFAGDAPSLGRIVKALGPKQVLLVLDNCEHVIDRAAEMAEAVVRANPNCRVLATSREPLRAEGEWTYPVPPLEVPSADTQDLPDWRRRGAVGLFLARALAADPSFSGSEPRIALVGAVCRRLDGIPLAIELAASRAATLGLTELAGRLDHRFNLLTGGRRTAMPRQQTLRATLDWSYDLLPETERFLLRHLAVFVGEFTLEGATAVTSGTGITAGGAIEAIANLVAKSLVIFDKSGSLDRWRMLETIRAYALEKLKANHEFEAASGRHANYHSDLFGHARSGWESQPTSAWLAEYGHRLDDLRATLDWAFSSGGDAALGIALTADAVPLWMQRSLIGECRRRVEQALSCIEAETSENARLRMRLRTALSLSRMYAGDPLPDIDRAWSATLDLAGRVGDPDYQLRAIWGLFAGSFNRGDFPAALGFAEQFCRVATGAADQLIGERLVGTALHILGDQKNARRHIEHMLAGYTAPATSSHIIRYQNDQEIAARRVLAPILWLQGYRDQAMRMVQNTVTDALGLDHALTLCNLLAQAACPLAFLTGDLSAARRFTEILIEQATRHSLDVWNTYGRCFEGLLLTREGDFENGLEQMREAGNELHQAGFLQYYTPYLGLLAEALGAAGQIAPGLAAIDEAIARAERTEERWGIAELLRIKGELLRLQGGPGAAPTAADHFQQALDWARRQGALSWELRAATSMARLLRDQGRSADGMTLLRAIYDRFTEGFDTTDLKAAKALLHNLG